MARRSLADNVRVGILSINNAAELTGLAATRIRDMVDEGLVKNFLVPGTKNQREIRISAASLLKCMEELSIKTRFPIGPQLREAADNFNRNFTENFERKSQVHPDSVEKPSLPEGNPQP